MEFRERSGGYRLPGIIPLDRIFLRGWRGAHDVRIEDLR